MSDKQYGESQVRSCEGNANNHNYYYYQQGWDQLHNLPVKTVGAYGQVKCSAPDVVCTGCEQHQSEPTPVISYTTVQSRTLSSNVKCQCKLKAVMLGHDNHPQPRNDNSESPSCWRTVVSQKQAVMCTGEICQTDLTSAVASGQRLRGGSEIFRYCTHTGKVIG